MPLVEALEKTARGPVGLGADASRSSEVAEEFTGVEVRALKGRGQKAWTSVVRLPFVSN